MKLSHNFFGVIISNIIIGILIFLILSLANLQDINYNLLFSMIISSIMINYLLFKRIYFKNKNYQ